MMEHKGQEEESGAQEEEDGGTVFVPALVLEEGQRHGDLMDDCQRDQKGQGNKRTERREDREECPRC